MPFALIAGPGVNNYSGFGDVIFLAEANYCAATSLDLRIIYHELQANRSGQGIFEAFGLNQAMHDKLEDFNFFQERITTVVLPEMIRTPEMLEAWRSDAAGLCGKLPPDALINFKFANSIKLSAIPLIDFSIKGGRCGETFGSYFRVFENFRERNYGKSLFSSSKRKILMHIRRGDIGLFRFSDGRVATPWGIDDAIRPALVTDPNRLMQPFISDQAYAELLEIVIEALGSEMNEIVVVSDGHQRGERILRDTFHLGILTASDIQLLPQMSLDLDNAMRVFYKDRFEAKCLIDEDNPNMVEICATAVDADIVISLSGGFLASALRYFRDPKKKMLAIFNGISKSIVEAGRMDQQPLSVVGVSPRELVLYLDEVKRAVADYLE